MTKWILALIVIALLITGCQSKNGLGLEVNVEVYENKEEEGLKVGEFVIFGSYKGDELLFRIINKDEDGNPLLYSYRVIDFLPFDYEASNRWATSSLRDWLNDDQEGFLKPSNIDPFYLSLIKATKHKALLSESNIIYKSGGESGHEWSHMIDTSIANYDSSYYEMVEDKVFLLSIKEFKHYLVDRGWEYRSEPTLEALKSNPDKDIRVDNGRFVSEWIRTPYYKHTSLTRTLALGGYVEHDTGMFMSAFANSENMGVSPAFYLIASRIEVLGGTGEIDNPYRIKVLGVNE